MERFKEDRGEAEGTSGKTPKKKEEELEIGQKSLEAVYGQTGLDPAPEPRKKVLRRAKNLRKAKNKEEEEEEEAEEEEEEVQLRIRKQWQFYFVFIRRVF